MSVRTIFRFERGREVRWACGGLLLGSVIAVVPVELLLFIVWLPFVALYELLSALGERSARTSHVLFWWLATAIIACAVAAPKGVDRTVQVSATTLTLRQLAVELKLQGDPTEERVTLPSTEPTWREVEAAVVRQTSMSLRPRTCVFAMSLLTGPIVFGGELQVESSCRDGRDDLPPEGWR